MPFITIDIAYRQKLIIGYLCLSSYLMEVLCPQNEDKGKETLGMVCLHLLWNVPNQGKRTSEIRRCWIKGILLHDKKLALSCAQVFKGGSLVFGQCHNWKQKLWLNPGHAAFFLRIGCI